MGGRPRKASDDQVFTAVQRVITRLGPAQVTLAEIAREAGVTASALVQRFGSKRDLLLAFSALGPEATRHLFAHLRAAHASPLAAIRAYASCMAALGETPETLAHHLGYLQIDIGDPDFRKHMTRQARITDREIRRLIEAAVEAGELVPDVDPARLSRLVQAVVGGSMFAWAFWPRGTAARYVRDDLNAVLEPHLP
jgi:AcrR family transcriptional regulator